MVLTFEANKHSLICENHFTNDKYLLSGGIYGKNILRMSSIKFTFIVNGKDLFNLFSAHQYLSIISNKKRQTPIQKINMMIPNGLFLLLLLNKNLRKY